MLALAAIPLVVLAVFFVYPVLGIVGQGFVSDGRFAPGAVLEVLGRPRTGRVLWFTLWSAGLATLVTLLAGLPLAFVLHRLSFPGRGLLRALVVVPFVLPTVVVGVAFGQLVAPSGWLGGLHLEGTAAAIVAALVFFNVSVVVRTVGSFWESLDPRREQAAAALGASPLQVFRDGHAAGPAAGGRGRGDGRVPLLLHRVRHRPHARGASLRQRRDRDLAAHHPGARPRRCGCAVGAPARRDRRSAGR